MIKKFFFLFLLCAAIRAWHNSPCHGKCTRVTTALTSGYVFKHDDCRFKEVYGRGVVNVLTADGCYYFWNPLGIGAKVSYWQAKGCTTFLKQSTKLQEVPTTAYLRARADFSCVQLYASLGGGVLWLQENSYLGCVHLHKGVGEVEAGLSYIFKHHCGLTTAFRYLFSAQSFDLRAGLQFTF